MSYRGAITAIAVSGLIIGLNAGCLSLHLFNRESADTRARLEALEQRISTLESANSSYPSEVVPVPGTQRQLSESSLPVDGMNRMDGMPGNRID